MRAKVIMTYTTEEHYKSVLLLLQNLNGVTVEETIPIDYTIIISYVESVSPVLKSLDSTDYLMLEELPSIIKVDSFSTKEDPALYVLAGAWNTQDYDGTVVLGISKDIQQLKKQLKAIRESKANEYLSNPYGSVVETFTGRIYEIIDEAGGYAKFYITEHKMV